MEGGFGTEGRILDTFAARNLEVPERKKTNSDIGRYSVKNKCGLELRKYRYKQVIPKII